MKRISKQTEKNLLIILGTFVFTVALIVILAQTFNKPEQSNAIADKESEQSTQTAETTTEPTAGTTESSTTEAQQTTASTVDSTIQSQVTQINEWQQRATDLAEDYNSNSYTEAEIIVLTTAKLSVEYGLNDPKEIQEVQNFLTDNSWEHSYTDEEPEEQGARVPYMTALYYWNQTARNGDQDQSDRLGRVGVSLSHDGYTPDQITGLTDQLISELKLDQ